MFRRKTRKEVVLLWCRWRTRPSLCGRRDLAAAPVDGLLRRLGLLGWLDAVPPMSGRVRRRADCWRRLRLSVAGVSSCDGSAVVVVSPRGCSPQQVRPRARSLRRAPLATGRSSSRSRLRCPSRLRTTSGRSSRNSRSSWEACRRCASSTTRTCAVASVAGEVREWNAVIDEQRPDERIAWHSTTGKRNTGLVTFHRLDDNRSKVLVQMDFEPSGMREKLGHALGLDRRRVRGDLRRFKELIESRPGETGAWRGEVQAGERVDQGL